MVIRGIEWMSSEIHFGFEFAEFGVVNIHVDVRSAAAAGSRHDGDEVVIAQIIADGSS